MLITLMAKVVIISICLVGGINLTYTNRKGSVFLTISCMITPRRHVRIDAGNYRCNECIFQHIVLFAKFIIVSLLGLNT